MNIIWKDIQGYENEYSISNTGVVKGKKYNRELKPFTNKDGYQKVILCKDGKTKNFYLHRIVAQHFKDNFNNKPQVNHIDGIKTNNHHTNLEWCNNSENQRHAIRIGLKKIKYGKDTPTSKFTNQQVREIRELFATGKYTIAQLAREFNVAYSSMYSILTYETYKN